MRVLLCVQIPLSTKPVAATLLQGPVVLELRQRFAEGAYLTTRLWRGMKHVESEWTVGPLDQEPMDVIVQFNSSLKTGKHVTIGHHADVSYEVTSDASLLLD